MKSIQIVVAQPSDRRRSKLLTQRSKVSLFCCTAARSLLLQGKAWYSREPLLLVIISLSPDWQRTQSHLKLPKLSSGSSPA